MRKLILLISFISFIGHLNAQDASNAAEPNAAISVVESLTNTFLPGVFTGVKGLLGEIKETKKNKEDLSELKNKIETLEGQAVTLSTESKTTLENLKSYYASQALDFKTLNEVYVQISIFSTKVSSLTMVADLLTHPDFSLSKAEAEIALINRTKDAARAIVVNFDVTEDKLVSENTLLNKELSVNIRTINEVIQRIKSSGLTAANKHNMTSKEIENYLELVKDIKLYGSSKFVDLENSIKDINTAVTKYLTAFEIKTKKINAKIDDAILKIENAKKDKDNS